MWRWVGTATLWALIAIGAMFAWLRRDLWLGLVTAAFLTFRLLVWRDNRERRSEAVQMQELR